MSSYNTYHLYSSEGCHLCEQAYALCYPLLGNAILVVDIVNDDDLVNEHGSLSETSLVEKYGVHIPVLKRNDNGQELFWPFTIEQIQIFIK